MMRLLGLGIVFVFLGCEGPVTDVIVPLGVLNWYPSGNATCAPRETGVWITFSEPVVEDTLTAESVGLFAGGVAVATSMSYQADTWTVQLVPEDLLDYDTTYEVRLESSIASEGGGSFGTALTSSFSTLPQSGCASALACHVDGDCTPQICSVTGACVAECAVPEDCPAAGQVCVTDRCE